MKAGGKLRTDDYVTYWVVLHHPVYGHLGWFLGWHVFHDRPKDRH